MAKPKLRCTVPIVGTGLNRWLLGSHRSPILTDWWDLMSNVAWYEGILPNQHLEGIFYHHKKRSPTFVWEALLHEYKQKPKATDHPERTLMKNLAQVIRRETTRLLQDESIQQRRERFLRAMGSYDRSFSVISLNYDHLLLPNKGGQWLDVFSESISSDYSRRLKQVCLAPKYHKNDQYKVWFPHGSINNPEQMVAGFWRYARATAHVVDAINQFKAQNTLSLSSDSIETLNEHRQDSSEVYSTPTWVSDAINAPLLLLGVGCTQEETDIWTFLHRRAREHQRLGTKAPPIWRFSCKKENPSLKGHWESLSAGLNIIDLELGVDWDDAWSNLLSILESDSSLFA